MIKNRIAYNEYCSHRINLSRAEGSYVWDERGKRYIDFTSGWNVMNLGWNHPEVTAAIVEQAKKNVYAPLWGSDPVQEEYAEQLTAVLPKELAVCVKATGGTEAIEESIKIARAATGRKKIIGFRDTYHGQLFAAMALGFSENLVRAIAPLVPEFIQLTYPRDTGDGTVLQKFLNDLETALSPKDIAAIVTEPGIVTGWGSVVMAPSGYLKEVRQLASKYGTLLIVDEVGTGFSRTGKFFGIEREEVIPDMICLAKGISNGGAAIGAVVGKSEIIEPTTPSTNLTSTFGWTPIACAAALKTLEIHQREKTWEQSQAKGSYLITHLKSRLNGNPRVVDIRGLGMEIGIEIQHDATLYNKILATAADNGLHLVGNTESLIQIMPPLTIPQGDLDEGLEILIRALSVS